MSEAPDRGSAVAPGSGYRIGTAERDRVRDLLERHTAEGRLSLDEFGDRVEEVLRATRAVDLQHALRELPPAPVQGRWPAHSASVGTAPMLARRVAPVALFGAVALVVVGVLTVVGALWPLWILLLVTKFVFIGSRGRGRGQRWGGPPWGGPYPAQRANRWESAGGDPSSQTRWV